MMLYYNTNLPKSITKYLNLAPHGQTASDKKKIIIFYNNIALLKEPFYITRYFKYI